MLDFETARKHLLDAIVGSYFSGTERVALRTAHGRVLAENVVSTVQVPSHDYSAMDGYAVSSKDFADAADVVLPVVGECRTGHPGVSVAPKTCVRIFTGAHLPQGADAVVMQENVSRVGELVTFRTKPKPFDNVRRAGEDLSVGDVVLSQGQRLTGFQLGLLATVERTEVCVAQRPRVVVLCTGDELRAPGAGGEDGSLAESNSASLAALAEACGAQVTVSPIVRDEPQAMEDALRAAKKHADVIVTVGGVSVGDHDVVPPALLAVGAEIRFHKVKIKPGKPVLFATWGDTLVLGLPGNPSSAQVTFAIFGFPLLRALCGDLAPVAAERRARLRAPFKQGKGRTGFYRARLSGDEVEILPNQASGASTTIAWANALVVLPEDVETLEAGAQVSVLSYNDL